MIEVEISVHVTDSQRCAIIEGSDLVCVKHITDAYYDSPDFKLSTKGYWLRKRNNSFELKIPATTSCVFDIRKNTAMHEITNEQCIADKLALKLETNSLHNTLVQAGYDILYTLNNTRHSYTKNGFTVDFDHVDFGDLIYDMCEIEKMVENQDLVPETLESLYEFVRGYGIPTKKAEGKLFYYLKHRKPTHYNALIAAGNKIGQTYK